MSIAVTDVPRSIKGFAIEILAEGKIHCSESSNTLGSYVYCHDSVDAPNRYRVEEWVAPDLADVVRKSLAPHHHAEGWVRFSVRDISFLLASWTVNIEAIDAVDGRHAIDTGAMQKVEVAQGHVERR